jgi:hypothetical protein
VQRTLSLPPYDPPPVANTHREDCKRSKRDWLGRAHRARLAPGRLMILLPHRSHCGPCVMAIPPHPQITQICTQSEQAELPLVMDIPSAHGACACACARLRQFTALLQPIRATYPSCAGRAHTQSARAGQQLGANMSNMASMCTCWGWALPLVRRTFRFQLVRSRQPLQACFDVEHTPAHQRCSDGRVS